MDCRKFRDQHALFVDEMCSELEAFEMRSHMRFCAECDRHDTVVRRGIFLVRNLPSIRPSAGFNARLAARILAETPTANRVVPASPSRLAEYVSLAAAAVVLALGIARVFSPKQPEVYRMPPVVASRPVNAPSPFGTSALVATVPTGMSIWPAIVMASQAPAHFATAELVGER